MWIYLIIFLVLMFIIGNALVLLRTAKKPKIPDKFESQPYRVNDESGW